MAMLVRGRQETLRSSLLTTPAKHCEEVARGWWGKNPLAVPSNGEQ